ncbi:MAG: hypothetical protein HOQ24_08655 [Mycobacteriaceae bacterium]|nr:hypothetical protein [Mycobacteriaceae bacterium]
MPISSETTTTTFPTGTAEVVLVDAETARTWLQDNRNNRSVREPRVRQYRDDMTSGRWRYNGEAIKFAADGSLLDGQHRLHALAGTTDVTLPLLVVRGLPSDTQITMDQGAKRSPGDQLSLTGMSAKNTTIVAAALRVYMTWAEGSLAGENTIRHSDVSTTRVIEFAEAYPELVTAAEQFTALAVRVKARPAVVCAVAVRLAEIDKTAAMEFLRLLDTGAGLPTGSPILALRDRLDLIKSHRIRTSDREFIGLIVMAWNLWRKGRQVSKLQRPKGGWTPTNFPEPR